MWHKELLVIIVKKVFSNTDLRNSGFRGSQGGFRFCH